MLDALLRGADLACQVSIREGFEIKVTEVRNSILALSLVAYTLPEQAIHKTRWIIATRAGGIPLQIRDGVDGKLVPPGDPKAIAEAMIEYYTSEKGTCKTGESRGNDTDRPLGGRWTNEGAGPREELFSIGNATMWQVRISLTPLWIFAYAILVHLELCSGFQSRASSGPSRKTTQTPGVS